MEASYLVSVCLVVVLSLVHIFPTVNSIRCFKCDHNEVSSRNNFVISFLLKQVSNKVDHPECKMLSRRDRHFVDIVECPPPSDWGSTYVCKTVRGTVTGSWNDLEVQFDTLTRGCLQVPTGESSYDDRCVETAVMDGPTQFMVEQAIEALGEFELDADIHFKGKTCYDTNGVPLQGHQVMCPSCSFNELLSVDSLLGPVVDAFNKNNQEACRLQHPEDRYQVGYRICKPAYQGEVNKCALVQGEVQAKLFSRMGGGIDFRYNSVSRGCAQVDMQGRERERFRDGCHSQLPFSSPVRKILVQGYKGADEKDLQFKGKVCYNNDTFSAEKPAPKPKPESQDQPPEVAAGGQRAGPLVMGPFLLTALLLGFWSS